MAATNFDKAALFLLKMSYDNLFEDVGSLGSLQVRCKGCTAVIPRGDREKHHAKHKREEQRRAERETQAARERSLAAARRARAMRSRENKGVSDGR